MKTNLPTRFLVGLACLTMTSIATSSSAAPAGTGPSFKGPLGLQLYSLRDQFAKDVPNGQKLIDEALAVK